MNILNLITGLLIVAGSIIMFFAYSAAGNILKLLTGAKFYRTWKTLKFLILFFAFGYISSTAFIFLRKADIPIILTGTVFLLGACFVLIVVRSSFSIINGSKNAEAEIKKLNEGLEQTVTDRTAHLTEANENLKKSEDKYRKMVEVIGDVVYTSDYNGNFTYVNPAIERMTGYKQSEIVGRHFTEFISPEWKPRVAEFYRSQFKDKTEETLFSFPIITKTGEKKWVEQTVIQLREGNKIIGHRAVIRDISARKAAEDQLKDSEEQLKIIVNEAPDALIVMDNERKIIQWNPRAEKIFGWRQDEVIGKPISQFIVSGKGDEEHLRGFEDFIKTGTGRALNEPIELTAVKKNNSEFDAGLTISQTALRGKDIFIVFLRDISSRKKLENQMRESEQFLDSIIENIPSVIAVKEVKHFTYVRINRAAENLMGLKRDEIIGKTDLDFFPKNKADTFINNDKEALEKGTSLEISEESIDTKKGKHLLHTRIIPLNDEKGNPSFILEISEDITRRKTIENQRDQAEKLIRHNELKLRLILENIGEGVTVADKEKKIILSNRMAEEIIGIKQDTSQLNNLSWTRNYELYYPDEKTVFPSQNLPMERALKGESIDDVELIIEDPETKLKKLVVMNGRPIRDENNKIIAAVSTIRDVTRYKKLEKELEASEHKYRKLIGFARDNKN